MNYTNPTVKKADSTTIGVKVDRMLDEISFLKDKVNRLRYMLDTLGAGAEVGAFELLQLSLILEESREDSDLRRFPVAADDTPVLALASTETKEDAE